MKKVFLGALCFVAGVAVFAQSYWTGNGASGLSVAVLVPEGRGLAENEAYLPTMVQGVLVGDFAKFSAMKVIDRQNLEKVIAEGETGYYADESNFVQLGAVANVRYILNGALQKTGSGFSLQLKITEAASGASKAAYTGAVSAAELENLTGIKKASGDLLSQLGVSLTDAGKTALLGVSASNAQAETALARGITAQRSGTVIEAMSYYYEAARFDPSLGGGGQPKLRPFGEHTGRQHWAERAERHTAPRRVEQDLSGSRRVFQRTPAFRDHLRPLVDHGEDQLRQRNR
ncbi:MAG: hypothetical protein LBK73_16395 [Treponema sp.]|jgi:TolB-like protein|nr:hypothetical protein [Treponema sp.]